MVSRASLRVAVITSLLWGRKGLDERLRTFMHTLKMAGVEEGVVISGFGVFTERDLGALSRKIQGKKPGSLTLALLHLPLTEVGSTVRLAQRFQGVDVILFYLGAPAILPIVLGRLFRKKSVFVVTGMEVREIRVKQRNVLLRASLSQASVIYRSVCFHLVHRLGVESPSMIESHGLTKYRNKVRVFGTRYVDAAAFRPERPFHERENVVGYVGRLSQEKGVLNFVEAIPRVLASDGRIKFLIVGDGLLKNRIEERIRQQSVGDKVTLTGWVPHEKVPEWLNRLRLIILPSYTEGLPPLVQEAMACGTPVLATPVGGIPDLIKDGETGFLLEDNSPECIARRVLEVLNDPRLPEVSHRASAFIREHYSRECVTQQWREVLEELVKR